MPIDNHIHTRRIMLHNQRRSMHGMACPFQIWRQISLEDKPERGPLSDFDGQRPLTVVEGDESWMTQMLADNVNVDHSTIIRHLKGLNFQERLKNSLKNA